MATLDAADLLARCKRYAGLPASAEFPADADWYAWLTEAHNDWQAIISSQVPKSQWGTAVQMTTADGGVTYTVAGVSEFSGPIELRVTQNGSLIGSDEYILDGATVRWPFGASRSFAAGPYIRYATPLSYIDAVHEPTLKPTRARILLVFGALKRYAHVGGGQFDPGYWENLEGQEWNGDGNMKIGLLQNLLDVYGVHDSDLDESYSPWYKSGDLTRT